MINKYQLDSEKHQCFVLLSIIFMDKLQQNMQSMITNEDLPSMKRFLINQINSKKGNYHFNTTGTIYGLCYCPKLNKKQIWTFYWKICKSQVIWLKFNRGVEYISQIFNHHFATFSRS